MVMQSPCLRNALALPVAFDEAAAGATWSYPRDIATPMMRERHCDAAIEDELAHSDRQDDGSVEISQEINSVFSPGDRATRERDSRKVK